MKIPSEVIRICKLIEKNHGRAILVGGFVRDALLRKTGKDIDIEVYGLEQKKLQQILKKNFGKRVVYVGKQFGVFKIGTIDIALARTEKKLGKKHTDFEVTFDPELSYATAMARRDFTINAIGYDPLKREYIDPYDGRTDLNKKILRVVNERTFIEDPLRVYRALHFVSRFGLRVELRSMTLLQKIVGAGELENLSKERVTAELTKLLNSINPRRGFDLALKLDITPLLFGNIPSFSVHKEARLAQLVVASGDMGQHFFSNTKFPKKQIRSAKKIAKALQDNKLENLAPEELDILAKLSKRKNEILNFKKRKQSYPITGTQIMQAAKKLDKKISGKKIGEIKNSLLKDWIKHGNKPRLIKLLDEKILSYNP